jgi:hypothetical protein
MTTSWSTQLTQQHTLVSAGWTAAQPEVSNTPGLIHTCATTYTPGLIHTCVIGLSGSKSCQEGVLQLAKRPDWNMSNYADAHINYAAPFHSTHKHLTVQPKEWGENHCTGYDIHHKHGGRSAPRHRENVISTRPRITRAASH